MSKGQVNLEAFTLLGWAIVIVMAVFSTLIYMGVISPSQIIHKKCLAQGYDFQCIDDAGSLSSTSVVIPLNNYAPRSIHLLDGSAGLDKVPSSTGACSFDQELRLYNYEGVQYSDIPATGFRIGPEKQFNLVADITNSPQAISCDLKFYYQNDESGLVHAAIVDFQIPPR